MANGVLEVPVQDDSREPNEPKRRLRKSAIPLFQIQQVLPHVTTHESPLPFFGEWLRILVGKSAELELSK